MDVDLTKPLYLFILDLYRSRHMYPYYKEVIRKCSSTIDDSNEVEADGPVIAIRGSTKPFGSWSDEGIRARKISLGYYGLIINDFIPANSEYKWLDLTGKVTHGDSDIDTGYVYEPQPFINRLVTCEVPKPQEEMVIVVDSWAGYSSKITRQSLGDWFSAEPLEIHDELEKKSLPLEGINPNLTPANPWEASNLDSLTTDLESADVLIKSPENPIQIQNSYTSTCSDKKQMIDGLEDIVEESYGDVISTETENISTVSYETIHYDENENREVNTVNGIGETHIATTATSTLIKKEASEIPEIEQETSFTLTPVVASQTWLPSSDLTYTEMINHDSGSKDEIEAVTENEEKYISLTDMITKETTKIENDEKQVPPCFITSTTSNQTWSCRSSTEDTEMIDHDSGIKDEIAAVTGNEEKYISLTDTITKETTKIENDEKQAPPCFITPTTSNQTWSCRSSTEDQKDADVDGMSSETMICDVTPRCYVTPLDIRIADMPETATEVQGIATGYINIKNNPQATLKSPPVKIKVIRKADSPKFKPQPYEFSYKEENNEISEICILSETIRPLVDTNVSSVTGHVDCSAHPDDNAQQTTVRHPKSASYKVGDSSSDSTSNSSSSSSSSTSNSSSSSSCSSSSDSELESMSSDQELKLKITTAVDEKKKVNVDPKTPNEKESLQEHLTFTCIDKESQNNDDVYNGDTEIEVMNEETRELKRQKNPCGGDIDSNVKEVTNKKKKKKKDKKQKKKPTIKDLHQSGFNDNKNGPAENEVNSIEDHATEVTQEMKPEKKEKHNSNNKRKCDKSDEDSDKKIDVMKVIEMEQRTDKEETGKLIENNKYTLFETEHHDCMNVKQGNQNQIKTISDEDCETKGKTHVGGQKKDKKTDEKDADKSNEKRISDDSIEHENSEQIKNTFLIKKNNQSVFAVKDGLISSEQVTYVESNSIQSDEITKATHQRMTRISEADTPETDHVLEIMIGEEASTFIINSSE